MSSIKNYDLGERTFKFAQRIREFIKKLPRTTSNLRYIPQLIDSSGSVAANFIESVEALSMKDSIYRKKICRKEAKESRLWLRLIETGNSTDIENERICLINESDELLKIFGSIICKKESMLKNSKFRT